MTVSVSNVGHVLLGLEFAATHPNFGPGAALLYQAFHSTVGGLTAYGGGVPIVVANTLSAEVHGLFGELFWRTQLPAM